MSARAGMLVTVTRPPGRRRMPPPRSPDLFCLSVATSKLYDSPGCGACCAETTTVAANRHTANIQPRMLSSQLKTFGTAVGLLGARVDGGNRAVHLPGSV